MKEISHNARLTSAEIANLWSQYINDSMSICVLKYYLESVQDREIRSILQYALRLSQSHIVKIKYFFNKENYPIPVGFTDEDVNLDAPPLFKDTFMIVYMHVMAIHGLSGYAGAVSTSIRSDQIDYFVKCSSEAMELYKRVLEILVEKGLIGRPSNINAPNKPDFVKKQSFLTGWFGERRPLNALEASGIFFNMKKNAVKVALEVGFGQVAQTKEVQDYLKRGEKICEQHYGIFNGMLSEDKLSSPPTHSSEITSSTVAPFSEKLMIFHIMTLISTAIGYYGAAFSLSQRRDLAAKYTLLMADVAKYAEDGVNLMIDRGWMEQPPTFTDREELTNSQNQ